MPTVNRNPHGIRKATFVGLNLGVADPRAGSRRPAADGPFEAGDDPCIKQRDARQAMRCLCLHGQTTSPIRTSSYVQRCLPCLVDVPRASPARVVPPITRPAA